jgi:predicted N-formylglutamate amidohydrolase
MAEKLALLLTCEHGGNRIPPAYQSLFRGRRRLLESHRGYDRGALAAARAMAGRLDAPLIHAEVSRLLVDLNRSPRHRALFSEATRGLPGATRADILARHYWPHRLEVERWIGRRIDAGRTVIHVAVHSFTPVLNGERRRAGIGLLYDPARPVEAALCAAWKAALKAAAGSCGRAAVRRNYPYKGVSDGLTRHLRARFAPGRYAGVELELNQALLRRTGGRALARCLAETLADAMQSLSNASQTAGPACP